MTPLLEIELEEPKELTKNKEKIQILQDTLEFSFPACDKLLKGILSELGNPSTDQSVSLKNLDLLQKINKVCFF